MSLRCSVASDSGPDSTKRDGACSRLFPRLWPAPAHFHPAALAPEPVHGGWVSLPTMSVLSHVGARPFRCPPHEFTSPPDRRSNYFCFAMILSLILS